MSHSVRVTREDLRKIFRILGDARDLRFDQGGQELCIINGLCELIGASVGWAASFDQFRPGKDIQITRFVPADTVDEHWLDTLAWWGQISDPKDDALLDWALTRQDDTDVIYSSESITWDKVTRYPSYEALGVPMRIIDSLAAHFRYPGSDRVRGYALQRLDGDRRFTPRQAAVAKVFAEELLLLYRSGHLEPVSPHVKLPPRLQRILPLLKTGLSQKQIAVKLGLSYQTVRSYAKELYELMGVRSREELAAKVRGEG